MRSKSLKEAQKRYYEKNKNTEVYQNRLKKYRKKNKNRYDTDEEYRNEIKEKKKLYYYKNKSILE